MATIENNGIKVTCTAEGGCSVEGPREFTASIDWDAVMSTAALFAVHAPSAEMAVCLAVQQKYASWNGMRSLRRAVSL